MFFWLIASLTVLSVGPAYAIDPNRAMSQYLHDRWGPERGFPRGPVYAIAQTPDGYLWIGTEAGLVRFDGLNFQLVQDSSSPTPITAVLGLAADNEGNLWVRLQGPTMLRYRNGVFEDAMLKLGMPYSNITTMARTNQGNLLVGRLEEGSIQYKGGRFEVLGAASPLARSPVISMAQTPAGDLWMGTRDAGLFRADGKQTTAISKGLPDTKINSLLPEGDRNLWVGTDNGLVRWNGTELTSVGIPAALNNFQALAMARDRDGNIWVGTDSRGLLRFNAHGVSSLDPGHRGTGEAVTALFEDREGSLWIGSAGSLERLRDSAFVTYSLAEGLPADGSNPVFVDAEKRVWFPPLGGGLWWLKDGQHGRVDNAELERDVVYSIVGGKDELWLGRQHGGLTRLRPQGNSFKLDTWTQADGLAQDSVYSVYQARGGIVWAGTLSGGVSSFENGKFKNYTTANGLASNTVSSILEGADETMWFATPNGLSAFAKDRWQTYTARDGLPSDNLNSLLEDSTGVLWVGTVSGIAFRGPRGFLTPRGAPPSLREPILGMAEDRFGSLWVSTSNHVLRVKRDKLLQGTLVDGDVREYGLADGLRGLEGVKRHRSVVADPLGRIWFSMNRGISVVDPERLKSNSIPVMVQVQTVAADGTSISLQGAVRIPADPKRIVFGLAGLSLSVPERVRFRYSLDGFDHGWSEPTTAHEAAYTNLGPGAYRFRVIASNPDGVWNNQETVLGFSIAPLFWQTWWFRVIGVVLFGLAVLALYRLRLQQLTSRLNVRFEERLAERTRIAQELHDTLLQGFLSASMQLHVAADYVPEDSPAKKPLGRIIQLMGQVIEEGRTALKGLRSSHSASVSLEQAFSEIKNELAIEDEIEFRVIVDGLPQPLHPILRDEVYRIGREALVNAFRHSRAKAIEVELDYTTRYFRFLVRDNGCGIAPDVVESGREGHWGLPGMRERAESIGGQFHVWSSAAAGTEVVLSVPGSVAFQHESPARRRGWFGKRHSGHNGIAVERPNGRNQ
jgi:ligand-binding sensor domain-containing protein/signal transduction histidine kinase